MHPLSQGMDTPDCLPTETMPQMQVALLGPTAKASNSYQRPHPQTKGEPMRVHVSRCSIPSEKDWFRAELIDLREPTNQQVLASCTGSKQFIRIMICAWFKDLACR